jgi:RimJ/RimL family protein N-acetyltransferase
MKGMTDTISPTITALDLDDIPHLIDCVRRCYGESYDNPMMYDVAQLEDVINKKQMYSVVAKLDDGRVIGHCALSFDGTKNTAPEAGKMIVDPDFRGHHIAELMAKKRIEIAQSLDLPGFWTECVTNHPYSQHEMIAFNAKETGLFISNTPASFSMQGLQNFSDTRMSLLTFYLALKDLSHAIFLPTQHIEHIQRLAQELNLKRVVADSSAIGSGSTTFITSLTPADQIATISIDHIGSDLLNVIVTELQKPDLSGIAAVYIDLPIEQKAAANAYSQLETIGFFWGAWIPNFTPRGDIMRLQKVFKEANLDEIVCAREQGETVKKYVISEWLRVSQKQ